MAKMTSGFLGLLLGAGVVAAPMVAVSAPGARPSGDAGFVTLLISEATFVLPTSNTPFSKPRPKNARLEILQLRKGVWHESALEDPDSTVFHKAIPYTSADGARGILTAGGDRALLQLWTRGVDGSWHDKVLWEGIFGGRSDRIRDFEIGDVNGDGREEIVLGTHDQGVIEVLSPRGKGWIAMEVWRQPDTFVHEIELADLDGDGVKEIYATPSQRNLKQRTQGGGVLSLRWDGDRFRPTWLARWPRRHAKEILATDLGDGPVLVTALEAEATNPFGRTIIREQMQLLQHRWVKGGGYATTLLTGLAGQQCRFLIAVDADGDGQKEILASTMRAGVFLLDRDAKGWFAKSIDRETTGIEDAMGVLPSATGKGVDVFVSCDDKNQLVWLRRTKKGYAREVIKDYPQAWLPWYIHAYRTRSSY